jgi:hypothetical protein
MIIIGQAQQGDLAFGLWVFGDATLRGVNLKDVGACGHLRLSPFK